ncbi:Xanthine oxidase / xanthine dehydrogenase, molybdenum binding subunit apoprotein [Paraglaciecola sp. T6c]|uniref:xanthine dehydrogenase molybdopterin binding subunit n=1 Tax=Pseudoalteromonas atlantica (strain T6c / ATCC BAA-1087) TaxID=3042615 RepID=UPI00005C5742|nr:xanthine dehydrogenase molybdopterin binding subunit [Paraglaciecola sp. T6c]ABG40941.1 Xanthine oxidase / xanthine dehydrogenase, molybdenum binding subunit apoprotein [Paraglaciecola sp. T6c]
MRKLIEQPFTSNPQGKVGKSHPHESAIRQVSGQARYVDDMPQPANLQYAAVGTSPEASGALNSIDLTAVWASPGVTDVITVDDVPGHVDIAPVFDGDPIFAQGNVLFNGQALFAVLADSVQHARQAALKAKVDITPLAPCLTVEAAKQQSNFVRPAHFMQQGDFDTAIGQSELNAQGHISIGGQEHMYLEGQVSMAINDEEDRVLVYTSSQHPSEVQKLIAEVLGCKLHKVVVDMRRMGGGFGGKETQAAQWACIAALLAKRNLCAVKLRLPRMQDMIATGKRHPFENSYQVGFNSEGLINAADIDINGNCGHSPDLSDAIVDRAMFHCDNGYYLENVNVAGHRCRTNQVSHTAYRGFGGPQGMIVAEAMMDAVARKVGKDPLTVRKLNLYGDKDRNLTPYGMTVEHNLLGDLIARLETSSDYWARREAITQFNKSSPIVKKGLALTPVKFGISFTAKHLNQAGALLHVYTDGSMQINHGGTEMGQGLHTKIGQIVANEFGISLHDVEVTATRTDKVPNTSPTAASSGTDLNGKAAQNACISVKQRLAEFYAKTIDDSELTADKVTFADNRVTLGQHNVEFVQLVQDAYIGRVSLSSTGFYKTPKIHYDRSTGNGRPFFYFAYGASVSEVSIDTLTGEYKVERVDILHDVGRSLNPAIDIGQIEGGFIQGMGWLTTEDLKWDDKGRLISNNPATYKIPAIGDTPDVFNVDLYPRDNDEDSIYHSKAVGEPPFMLANSVWCAIKDAISSLTDYKIDPQLPAPATPEAVLKCIMSIDADPTSSEPS